MKITLLFVPLVLLFAFSSHAGDARVFKCKMDGGKYMGHSLKDDKFYIAIATVGKQYQVRAYGFSFFKKDDYLVLSRRPVRVLQSEFSTGNLFELPNALGYEDDDGFGSGRYKSLSVQTKFSLFELMKSEDHFKVSVNNKDGEANGRCKVKED